MNAYACFKAAGGNKEACACEARTNSQKKDLFR